MWTARHELDVTAGPAAIVGALCQCEVEPIAESDFGNLYEVDLGSDGTVLKAEQTPDY